MTTPTRVLIVDDRLNVRVTLRHILRGFECDFSEAEDGDTALDLIATREFDVIFLDLRLRELSGLDILREARKLCATLGKVIILTGLPEPATQEEATKLGVFKYLTKAPINRSEVRNTFIEAITGSTPPPSQPQSERTMSRAVGGPSQPRVRTPMLDTGPTNTNHPHLLVLDDNRSWLDIVAKELRNDFNLTLTTSADEACKRIRKEHFALVVLDMRLPGGVTGLDVLSRMRRFNPDLRAIILTGHPDPESEEESRRLGALRYVAKGGLSSLAHTVKSILSEIDQPETSRPIRVFLSYDRRDRVKVSRLYKRLMGRGFLPWMDIKSIIGGKWEPQIKKAIDQADYFVFCLSHNSLYKEGVIRKEIRRALERQKGLLDDSIFFITARLENCKVTEPFTEFQYFDLFRPDGFTRLLRALASDSKANA